MSDGFTWLDGFTCERGSALASPTLVAASRRRFQCVIRERMPGAPYPPNAQMGTGHSCPISDNQFVPA
jgi:hypothetical protein